ncbi:hypothetical protein RUND412_008823 [Rhizina undulata]
MQPQSPPFPEDITFAFITSFLLQDLTTQEIIFDLDTVHETPALLTLQLAAERGYVKPKDLVKEPFQRLIMMLWLRRYDITQEHAVKSLRTVVKNRWEMWEVEGPTWEEAGEPRVAVDRGKTRISVFFS